MNFVELRGTSGCAGWHPAGTKTYFFRRLRANAHQQRLGKSFGAKVSSMTMFFSYQMKFGLCGCIAFGMQSDSCLSKLKMESDVKGKLALDILRQNEIYPLKSWKTRVFITWGQSLVLPASNIKGKQQSPMQNHRDVESR